MLIHEVLVVHVLGKRAPVDTTSGYISLTSPATAIAWQCRGGARPRLGSGRVKGKNARGGQWRGVHGTYK